MDDLHVLTPPTQSVAYRGETLVVSPLTLGQLSGFVTATRTLIGRVIAVSAYASSGAPVQAGALLIDLVEQEGDAIATAGAIVTGKPADWIAGGSLQEVAALAEAVVALNQDFFARRLPMLLQAVYAAVPQTTQAAAGPTSSTTSSPVATDTPT